MPRFFSGWATWEKLVFILACAIFVTVLLGCIKLGYSHWKLRKYTAVAERQRREQGVSRTVSQRRRQEAADGTDEPFGIKAMERGRVVEGVWNSSGCNTPVAASRETSATSSLWGEVSLKGDHVIDIEKQEMHSAHDRSGSNSTTGTARPPSSVLDKAVSNRQARSHRTSRDSSPDAAISRPPKLRHPPSSLSKYDMSPYVLRQDSAALTLKGIDAVHDAFGTLRGHGDGSGDEGYGSNESSKESSYGSTDTEPISASAPGLLNHHPRPRHQSTDLDLMQNHRMSQAAETGQLTPRIRRPGHSADWTNVSRASQLPPESNDYFNQPDTFSHPPNGELSSYGKGKNALLPKINTLPAAVRRSSLPDVTPFAKFCQTAPSSPISPLSRPASVDDKHSPHLRGNSQSGFTSAPSPATAIPLVELPSPTQPTDQHRPKQQDATGGSIEQKRTSSFEPRSSAVVRGHGTGFEILRAGTLNPVIPGENPLEKQRAGPPISLHNGDSSRPRSSSTDSRRKLRKKRWSIADRGRGDRISMIS